MSADPSTRRLRPWYLLVAMSLTWVVGVFGATAGCAELGYLRGSQELPDALRAQETAAAQPLERLPLVVEKARMAALALHHERSFPLSAANMLLCVLLALVSGAAMAGRRGARNHAVQVVAVNALLGVVAYVLLGPVREAVADAVARDMVQHGGGGLPELGEEQTATLYRSLYLWVERLRLALLELGVFGGALLALTRERTKKFFLSVETALAAADHTGRHES